MGLNTNFDNFRGRFIFQLGEFNHGFVIHIRHQNLQCDILIFQEIWTVVRSEQIPLLIFFWSNDISGSIWTDAEENIYNILNLLNFLQKLSFISWWDK